VHFGISFFAPGGNAVGIIVLMIPIVNVGLSFYAALEAGWLVGVAHLYGIETSDLRMVLAIARWLGMRGPPAERAGRHSAMVLLADVP